MSWEILLIFVAASAVLALTPGPAMALLIANSSMYGSKAGLQTVIGNSTGLTILVTVATLGMSSLMIFLAEWFDWIRWIGALYLIWLGINSIRKAISTKNTQEPVFRNGHHFFRQGMFVSLSNPKVLLFLGAFFPQFVDQSANLAPQLVSLAILFVVVISLLDALLVITASRVLGALTEKKKRIADGFSGGLLILGGLWLATVRKS